MPSPRLPFSPTALPPQARSRSLSPPAQASQCSVRQKSSPPHSRNGAPGALGHRQRSSEVEKQRQVSFSPVLTLYSISGDIHFLKHFSILPGYQAFRHQENSTPIRRRKRSTLSEKPSTTSNKLSTPPYTIETPSGKSSTLSKKSSTPICTTGSPSGVPGSTGFSGSPRSSSSKSQPPVPVPVPNQTRIMITPGLPPSNPQETDQAPSQTRIPTSHRPRGKVEDGKYLPQLRKDRRSSCPSH